MGAGETIGRKRTNECDVHTTLRLPTGLFCAHCVKANALFFDKKPAAETPWIFKLWIYDLRTNMHFKLKPNPLGREDLDEFARLVNLANRHNRKATWSADAYPKAQTGPDGRWRVYEHDELVFRDKVSLDIFGRNCNSLTDCENPPRSVEIAR